MLESHARCVVGTLTAITMNAVFLVGGYAFFWPVLGVDPGRVRRPVPAARVGLMFALLLAFGLAVLLSNAATMAGNAFYRSLNRAGHPGWPCGQYKITSADGDPVSGAVKFALTSPVRPRPRRPPPRARRPPRHRLTSSS